MYGIILELTLIWLRFNWVTILKAVISKATRKALTEVCTIYTIIWLISYNIIINCIIIMIMIGQRGRYIRQSEWRWSSKWWNIDC